MSHDDVSRQPILECGPELDTMMFDLAPVSLWLEDLSAVRNQLTAWRAEGVIALRDHLDADPARLRACSAGIRVIAVNQRTLELFEARDMAHLVENLDRIFRVDLQQPHVEEFVQLWEGRQEFFSHTVNYTLSGRPLDIQLRGRILPGHAETWARVLVAIEDVTEQEVALRQAATAAAYAHGLFEHSPVAIWVEDYARIKQLFDTLRAQGVTDLAAFIDGDPGFVDRCLDAVRIVDINQRSLELYAATDKATLMQTLGNVMRGSARANFRLELLDLWAGRLFQQREIVNRALDGTPLNLHLQLSVFPDREADWSLVQIALVDISARKEAEAKLEFLGRHDGLTQLNNRSFFSEALQRLDREGLFPVTIVMADLNGLKASNDRRGHAAGDALLRRASDILRSCVTPPGFAARIGGDEFALLIPGIGEDAGAALTGRIEHAVRRDNLVHPELPLSLSLGVATRLAGESMDALVSRADVLMYESKRRFYAGSRRDRRRNPVAAVRSDA